LSAHNASNPTAPLSRRWQLFFVFIGALTALDGGLTLMAGAALAPAMLAESTGKLLAGIVLLWTGTAHLRGGRMAGARGPTVVAALALILYLGGKIAGSAWWQAL
jgi:hypothetical protein